MFFSLTKNEHLHVRVNLDLGMSKDVSGLRHMVLVARGFLVVVFAFKEHYKYCCNNFSFHYSSQLNFITNILLLTLDDREYCPIMVVIFSCNVPK